VDEMVGVVVAVVAWGELDKADEAGLWDFVV
jgi:hypothetical protein